MSSQFSGQDATSLACDQCLRATSQRLPRLIRSHCCSQQCIAAARNKFYNFGGSAAACSNKQRDSTIARQRLLPLPLQRHGRLSRARAPLLKPARRFSRLKLACEKRVRAQKHRAPSLDLPQRHHHHRQVKASATALECSHNTSVSRRRAQQKSRMLRAAARVGVQAHRHRRHVPGPQAKYSAAA